jgi:hypothetical protein
MLCHARGENSICGSRSGVTQPQLKAALGHVIDIPCLKMVIHPGAAVVPLLR